MKDGDNDDDNDFFSIIIPQKYRKCYVNEKKDAEIWYCSQDLIWCLQNLWEWSSKINNAVGNWINGTLKTDLIQSKLYFIEF